MTTSGEEPLDTAGGQQIHQEAHLTGAAGRAYQAGRDLHVHHRDGVRSRSRSTGPVVEDCPYPGLAAFGADHARWFYGRDRQVAELTGRLDERTATGGPLVVVAPSGAGKSSLLRAGLLPALAGGAIPGSSRWPRLVLTPTAQPVAALVEQIAASAEPPPPGADGTPAPVGAVPDPDGCLTALRNLGTRTDGSEQSGPRVLVVVDQLEELFTLCTDEEERQAFVDLLSRIASPAPDGGPAGLVVFGLRADFYARCASYPQLRAALQDSQLFLGPMSEAELREAILYPARDVGLEVEPGLVEVLLRDLGVAGADGGASGGPADGGVYEAGRLPLLAHALRATWQQRDGHTLTVEGYQATGGIHRAVSTTAERVFSRLDPAGQQAARTVFLRLVRLGEAATGDTRRRVAWAGFLRDSPDPAAVTAVVGAFAEARLLTRGQDAAGEPLVEITHEALISGWPRLREWIETDRAGNMAHQELEDAAAVWDGRDASLLYRGNRLHTARTAARTRPLSPAAARFLTSSVHHERRRKLVLRMTAAFLALLLAALGVTAAIVRQRTLEREHQRELTLIAAANHAGAEADALRSRDPALAMLLALAAYRLEPEQQAVVRARSSLLSATGSPHDTRILDATGGQAHSVVFDNKGRLLAAQADGTVQIWDPSDVGQPLAVLPPPDGAAQKQPPIAVSAEGPLLAVLVAPNQVAVWDLVDLRHPAVTITLDLRISDMALDRAGRILAVGTDENETRLFSLADPRKPVAAARWPNSRSETSELLTDVSSAFGLDSHVRYTNAVEFSPDGTILAVGSADATVNLWDVTDPWHPKDMEDLPRGNNNEIIDLRFEECGDVLVVLGDEVALVWNLAGSTPSAFTFDLDSPTEFTAAACAPGGKLLALATDKGPVILIDLMAKSKIGQLPHSAPVEALAFSPDNRFLASASSDGTGHLWRLPPAGMAEAGTSPSFIEFGGGMLAVGLDDGRIQLLRLSDRGPWEPTDPVSILPSKARNDVPIEIEISPDGTILTSTDSGDAKIAMWDIANPAAPVVAGDMQLTTGDMQPATALGVYFIPGARGRVMATTNKQKKTNLNLDSPDVTQLRFWDLAHPAQPKLLSIKSYTHPVAGTNTIPHLAVSPDGHTVALYFFGADGHSVRLLDITDPRAPRDVGQIPGRNGTTVSGVVFSSDAHAVVHYGYGGSEDTLELWSIAGGAPPAQVGTFSGYLGVDVLAINASGSIVAAATGNDTITLWETATGKWVKDDLGPAAVLAGHTAEITGLAFDSGGTTLASLSADGTMRLWDTDIERAARVVCEISGSPITTKEWESYFRPFPYEDPCGK